jgi:hypothetical protein
MADGDQGGSNGDAEALAVGIVAGFLLSDAAIAAMAGYIAEARLQSLTAAYTSAASDLSADVPSDWQPPSDVAAQMHDEAQTSADGIAQTYQHDITAAAVAFLLAWQHDHDGSLSGARTALTDFLSGWAKSRAAWKAQQVAMAETNQAAQAGIDELVQGILDGSITDGEGNAYDPAQLGVMVIPSEAAEPFCAEYAGNVYRMDDYDAVDLFPAHVSCPHELLPIILDPGSTFDEVA